MTASSMRRLLLLRHAKAEWPSDGDDHDRPLAKRGRRASALMGQYMTREGLLPDLAIISTARRTQETWELACPAFPRSIPRQDERRLYAAPAERLIGVIQETNSQVHALLLVGHSPGLQDVALALVGESGGNDLARLQERYPTAGLAVIDFEIERWSQLRPAAGKLERFVTPRSVGLTS